MAKDLNIIILLDIYGHLLTEKQRFAIDLYYNEDLSLAEIAEEINISRQGVRESIKQGEKRLIEYEKTLGLVKRFQNISAQLKKINELIEPLDSDIREKISELLSIISEEI